MYGITPSPFLACPEWNLAATLIALSNLVKMFLIQRGGLMALTYVAFRIILC
jgi:hypothetical protein